MFIIFILFLGGCFHFCEDERVALITILMFWRPALLWVKSIWHDRHKKPNCVHDKACEPIVVWHEHVFAKKCIDEINGRFDACQDSDGNFYVWDVGRKRKLFYKSNKSKQDTIEAAKVAANIYDALRD